MGAYDCEQSLSCSVRYFVVVQCKLHKSSFVLEGSRASLPSAPSVPLT